MRFALMSVAVNIVAGVGLFFLMNGVAGIAAATALAAWLNVAQMWRALTSRGHYRPTGPAVARLIRIFCASAILGALLWVASEKRDLYEPYCFGRKEVALVAAVGTGALVYIGLLFALGAVTFTEIRGALRRAPKSPDAVPGNPI